MHSLFIFYSCEKGVLWLKHFIQIHAGLLISNPELLKLLGPINGSIEHRISFQQSFLRLQGRLDLLIPQIKKKEEEDLVDTDEYLLVYTDKGNIYLIYFSFSHRCLF